MSIPSLRMASLVCLAAWSWPQVAADAASEPAASSCVVVTSLDGIVGPALVGYLDSGISETRAQGCEAMVLTMDTPGGTLDATRAIIQSFLQAPVPIIVFVAPTGARAGSAGMFITLAGHVAAMAPGTTIGAAHPVMVGNEADPDTMEKVVNDTAALARAIAERRDRNVQWAEQAVRESVSATDSEAKAQGVIDLVAPDLATLLERVDGRVVRIDGEEHTLRTRDLDLRHHGMTIQQRVQGALGDPNVLYVMIMIGMLGILIELSNPGLFIPGGIGVLSLLVAAVGMGAVPVNIAGLVMLVLAVALFVAEIYVVSYGLLTLSGVGLLFLGSALLMDRTDPNFFADADVRVSWGMVIPLAIVLGAAAGGLAWRAARMHRVRPWLGRDELTGALGKAITPIGPGEGQVRVRGEIWQAISQVDIPPGTVVRVQGAEDLVLRVEPEGSPRPSRKASEESPKKTQHRGHERGKHSEGPR